jgi:hypothetical protein
MIRYRRSGIGRGQMREEQRKRKRKRELKAMKAMKMVRARFGALATLSFLAGFSQVMAPEVAIAEQEEYARHSVELFLGGSSRFTEEEDTASGFSYGLGYEFRFMRTLGIGLTGEGTTGSLRDGLLIVPFYLHPWRGLRVEAAPGAEFSSEPTEFVLRIGLAYEFEIWKQLSLSPEYNVDFVQGEQTMVYGISIGWGF